jgi:anti-sigma factor ChrR (cupin superfamily)
MRVVHGAEHWHAEAEAARQRASEMRDAAAKRIMLRVADVCDTLANRAETLEASRRGPATPSVTESTEKPPATLGDVLYAKPKALVSEDDWAKLVQSIAVGDQLALHTLYEMAHRMVFTLCMRLTADRETAKELTIDVFQRICQRALLYDTANGTVLGWIMNQARALALDHLRSEGRQGRSDGGNSQKQAEGSADVLRPAASLQARLAQRVAEQTGKPPVLPQARLWSEPEWEQVAPGIECKLLATDGKRDRISMLVRLARGASYPAHTHAGVEELHLLDGELWIDERKLLPGDYNYAPQGTGDERVWSETGCTCVLITSTKDILH